MKTEFEKFAAAHGLDIRMTRNKKYYIDDITGIAKFAWDAQQAKIDKLEHELGNERCANRMLQHVLDNKP